jgi:hypothetical protein
MPKRLLVVFSLVASVLAIAACESDSSTNGSSGTSGGTGDGGTDATSGLDAGAPDATADARPQGCQPCVVGTSTIGNCCLQ